MSLVPPVALQLQIETERLSLRPLDDTNVASLVRHWGDAEVRRYLWDDQPVSYDMVSDIVTTSNRDFTRAGYGIWTVHLRGEQSLIGMCGLRQVKGTDWLEILYSLRPRYWKNGYATEAAAAIVRYAFDTLGVDRVLASSDGGNVASSSVLRRLGLQLLSDASGLDGEAADGLQYWVLTRERFRHWSIPPSLPPPSE